MSKKEYTKEQLDRLNADAEFQQQIANDEKLNSLFNARKTEQAEEDLETLMVLGDNVKIANMDVPPPTTAVLAFLDVIDSPFLDFESNKEPDLNDFLRALYILKHRENAVHSLTEVKRYQLILDKLKDTAVKDSETWFVYLQTQEKQASAWNDFDEAVNQFALELGVFNLKQAVSSLMLYLGICGGFNMLPDVSTAKESKKKAGKPTTRPGSSQ